MKCASTWIAREAMFFCCILMHRTIINNTNTIYIRMQFLITEVKMEVPEEIVDSN